ncbi:xanthine/uracil/vitamin C permease (plasmid) [Brevirhabdus pacifica]|uniref:Xanthine/uracil/vitamin C permease n=1 Tax=Brevirhabdus pacifica TaxID=1267768 RepID=A0A1P8QYG9_9RHOB|nr:xanthine/uracil/vitamin C permease [Brevirhabdus pacifica]APX91416.1 xanthine/uracil/vitamin C permease [Brevirhabdus pacifica]OWU74219.1 xanthine/uracil/vitamin C permease [Loktanella sp. 22II-4b]PJJ78970.1 AGZA family xanthine/uracil permease-like MFS transporter [Brevirhabdus pacifica]
MTTTTAYRYRLFVRGDSSAFWALFIDNLVNLMVLSGICQFVFQMPAEIVYGRIVPGAAVAILAGVAVYVLLARRVARKTGRDVTALPYGISTPVMFVYLFGVIGPIYWTTGDAVLAWQVGIGAGFVGGIVAALGAIVGPFLQRVTPRAGMLGTLCGIALVFIGAVPLAEIFENPLIGFTSLVLVLWGLVGRFRLPFDIPAGLLAIGLGTAAGLLLGQSQLDVQGIGFYPPLPYVGDMIAGVQYVIANPELLLVLVPVQIYNFIETMNNVESAEAAGDDYPVALCQVTDGAGTMLGALFGSPFPTTVYIGHPAYKRMNAHAGYVLWTGVVVALAAIFGLLAFINALIPIAAAAPILVFVAISLIANTARSVPPAHVAAVAVAILPHVSAFLMVKWGSLMGALGSTGIEGLPRLGDPALTAALLQQGAHFGGHQVLSQGAIITGLVWGAITASLIDGRFRNAAGFAFAAAAMTSVGIIHAPGLQMPQLNGLVGGYLIVAAFVAIYPMLARKQDLPEDPADPADPASARIPAE